MVTRAILQLLIVLLIGACTTEDNCKAASDADIIFICVKPGDIERLLKEVSNAIKDKIVISIAATLPLSYLKKIVPEAKFVRVMPNLAILVQESYTAYCCADTVTINDKVRVTTLLNMMGKSEEVDEKYMDAITGLSGSGPGYLAIIAEGMLYGGLKVGLPRNIALNERLLQKSRIWSLLQVVQQLKLFTHWKAARSDSL